SVLTRRRRRPPTGSGRSSYPSALGVVLHASEVEHDTRLIADHFTIVPRRDRDHIARTEIELGAVVHDHLLMPREDIAKVRRLAAARTGQRLDVLRPAPPRLACSLANPTSADAQK